MARILVFVPRSVRFLYLEDPILELQKRGHEILYLTIDAPGEVHSYYSQLGLHVGSCSTNYSNRLFKHFQRAICLARFVRDFKADIVFSHMQEANFPVNLGQFFHLITQYCVIFRHSGTAVHLADGKLKKKIPLAEKYMDRFINHFADKIVVPGKGVEWLMNQEGVDSSRIKIINYGYDFEKMKREVNKNEIESIRSELFSDLVLVSAMRFVPFKRHSLLIELMLLLRRAKVNFTLLLLDEGPCEKEIKELVNNHDLGEFITFLGRQPSVLPYLAAADLVLHPSITDASNSVVKEAGLVGTPAVVVQGVGDFDDYIVHGENSFLFPADKWVEGALQVCLDLYHKKIDGPAMGQALGHAVKARFSVTDAVIDQYEALIEEALRTRGR